MMMCSIFLICWGAYFIVTTINIGSQTLEYFSSAQQFLQLLNLLVGLGSLTAGAVLMYLHIKIVAGPHIS